MHYVNRLILAPAQTKSVYSAVRADSLSDARLISIFGPGSVVGIATAYGLDGPGIESRWGRDFPHQSRLALRPTQPPVQWVPEVRCCRGVTLTPHSLLVQRSKIE